MAWEWTFSIFSIFSSCLFLNYLAHVEQQRKKRNELAETIRRMSMCFHEVVTQINSQNKSIHVSYHKVAIESYSFNKETAGMPGLVKWVAGV